MSKFVLLSVCLLGLVCGSSLRGIEPDMPMDYLRLEQFIESFMDNYTHTNYNMTNCLTAKTQSKLNQILAASLGYLMFLDFDKVLQSYEDFILSLASACNECGLYQVEVSLKNGISEKGKMWFGVNLAYNSVKVMELAQNFTQEMEKKDYISAGGSLGKITSMLIPFEPAHMLGSFDQNIYITWWKGFIYTLAINPKKPGPCYYFLSNFSSQTVNSAMDIYSLSQGQMSGFNTLFGDLASSLTFVKANYTSDVCMFDQLESNILACFSQSGVEELFARFSARFLTINTAFLNIKNCGTSYYACGQGVATIIKYLLNWSIN
ncbi:hypothetical protein SteCoe_33146 [Stentor coeruleus]|uniref:Uncharacterized protein n=1 Tax=Stentor coeruleus TaxID=5963 RepID=A0A1R2AXD5_9CILI|nr:hypothetical protein SteCoe_33146 [Stentor coeruleus]